MSRGTIIGVALVASLAGNAYLLRGALSDKDSQVVIVRPVDQPLVYRTKGGLLEVSAVRAEEEFQTDKNHTLFGIPLGQTVAKISVPAYYRYHIELAPEWKILVKDNAFIVVAPAVKPALPVAIDTGKMKAQSSGTWSWFTGPSIQGQLLKSITASLDVRATDAKYIELQRETARKTVAEFVQKWLITQERWKASTNRQIVVLFADEPIKSADRLGSLF